MILRTLTLLALFVCVAAVAVAMLVLAINVLHPIIAWIAADERVAWGTVAVMTIIALLFVMEGKEDVYKRQPQPLTARDAVSAGPRKRDTPVSGG